MELLALILGVEAQGLIGVVGGIGAAGGAVAWVVRVENDLMSKYRSRVAELTRDLQEAERERDAWRNSYYKLVHAASIHGVPLKELGIEQVPLTPPVPPEQPPPLVPPL